MNSKLQITEETKVLDYLLSCLEVIQENNTFGLVVPLDLSVEGQDVLQVELSLKLIE